MVEWVEFLDGNDNTLFVKREHVVSVEPDDGGAKLNCTGGEPVYVSDNPVKAVRRLNLAKEADSDPHYCGVYRLTDFDQKG